MSFRNTSSKKRTTLSLYEEIDGYGLIPDPAPTVQALLERGDSLVATPTFARSESREPAGNIRGGIDSSIRASGNLDTHLIFGHYAKLLQAGWRAAGFSSSEKHIDGATTISFESIADAPGSYARILDSANGLGDYDVGETTRIVTAEGTNSKTVKIRSVAAGVVEIENGDFVTQSAATAGATTITQFPSMLNGTACRSFGLERIYTDQTVNPVESLFLGMLVNEIEMQLQPGQIINTRFGLVGRIEEDRTTSIAGATTPAPSASLLSAVRSVPRLRIGGESLLLSQMTLRLTNNAEPIEVVGEYGPIDWSLGDFELTGDLQLLMYTGTISSATEYTKAVAGTTSSLYQVLKDAAGNEQFFDFPVIRYTDRSRAPQDSGAGPIIVNLPFQVELNDADGASARYGELAAAA